MEEILWSVELEANSWNDDLFNGTYEQCVEYCRENNYRIDGIEARLAEIRVKENIVVETLEIVERI